MDILLFFVAFALVLTLTGIVLSKWVFPKWRADEILNKKLLARILRRRNLQALSDRNRSGD